MTKIKTLLLGTAAGLLAVAGAQAADMPVKAAPVQLCEDLQPVRGWVLLHSRHRHLPEAGRLPQSAGRIQHGRRRRPHRRRRRREAQQGRFTRDLTNDINYRVRGVTSWDVRQQTEYGTLRTYIRFGVENTTPGASGGGTAATAFWDRAFIQFAGFTVGRSQSFFDLFTYGGAYSYHNVRVSGDTGASGQNLWAYTAQFGNGFSGTLSLEDPVNHRGNSGVIDVTTPGFFAFNGAIANDNCIPSINKPPTRSVSGCRTSSPTCGSTRPGASLASAPLCITPAAPTTTLPTTSTTAIPKTSTAGHSRAAPSSTCKAATCSASTSATPKAQPAVAPTKPAGSCTTTATAWVLPGSPTACSAPAPRSSSRRYGVLLPRTSTSGTRNGGPRSVVAT